MTTYDITDYGAIGDGKFLNTNIIQNCIDECAKTGGRVIINNGTFVSGTIFMKSNVTLEITASAVLLASPDLNNYANNVHHHRYRNEPDLDLCWIYAEDAQNFSIVGDGLLDGNDKAFPSSFPNTGEVMRPMMFRCLRCHHIRIENLRLYNAASWTTAFLDSHDIHINNLDIYNDRNHNGDGLDFDGCKNVFVDNCKICGTDDNICLQASNKAYPVQNIHISNCQLTSLCAGIRIGLKSIGDIRDVVINNCTMNNIWREGIKIECSEGGNISNIAVNNIVMSNVRRPIYVVLNNVFDGNGLGNSVELTQTPNIGTLKRLSFDNIIITDTEEMKHTHFRLDNCDDIMGSPKFNGIRFDAERNHKIEQVSLTNIFYTSIGGVNKDDIPNDYPDIFDQQFYVDKIGIGNYYPDWSRTRFMDIRNVNGLYMTNIQFKNLYIDERPPYIIEHSNVLMK